MNPKFFWGQERTLNRDLETLDREKAKQPKWEDGGCDLLITIGTALAVHPFCSTVSMVGKDVPSVLINLQNTKEGGFDFEDIYNDPQRLFLKGYCDEVVK